MEIGSFIELQFPKGREFHCDGAFGGMAVARLNSGKAALWHAFRCTGRRAVWLPFYQCDTVREFFGHKGVPVRFYHIDNDFTPIDLEPRSDEAVLLVNYCGVMSEGRMRELAARHGHVIIDNCQAFFAPPIPNAMNVYSCRKFIGVPDGAYVIGDHADAFLDEYPRCFSSDTSLFLLQRIEYGCEGKAYQSRSLNERRIETENCMLMSKLTRTILDGTDYDEIIRRRRENFDTAHGLFAGVNQLNPLRHYDESCVPMVYPLVVEDDGLLPRLQKAKHFQGHWWSYLCDELPKDTFEHWLSRYIVPITIDQRYGEAELEYLHNLIKEAEKV